MTLSVPKSVWKCPLIYILPLKEENLYILQQKVAKNSGSQNIRNRGSTVFVESYHFQYSILQISGLRQNSIDDSVHLCCHGAAKFKQSSNCSRGNLIKVYRQVNRYVKSMSSKIAFILRESKIPILCKVGFPLKIRRCFYLLFLEIFTDLPLK